MKVLLVNSPLRGGGITTYATELIKCLSKDHDLTVVLTDDKLSPIKEPGVKVLYYDTQELSKKNALFFIKLINEELNPDLVISSHGLIVPIIVPYLNNNIKVITISHSGKLFSSDYCALNHKYTDTIIAAASDYNKRYLEKKFCIKDKDKVKVVYNFLAPNQKLEEYLSQKKNKSIISIIFPGGNMPMKSPDVVLTILYKLLKSNLNFKFYWTGETSLLPKSKIFSFIKPNDIKQYFKDDRIVFTGKIPSKTEYDTLLASTNILLAPSRNEGCSMILLEGIRSGSICIVGDYKNGNREIVERMNCGYVFNHHHPDVFVKQLVDIISNPASYSELYDNAYQAYKQKFTYPVWKNSMDEVLSRSSKHKERKTAVSHTRIAFDILKMKALERNDHVQRLICATKSLLNSLIQGLKMKISGDFPLVSKIKSMQ